MSEQATIAGPVTLEGVGLHSGEAVKMTLLPGDPGAGVVFRRVDLPGRPSVVARVENIVSRPRRTAIRSGEAEVHTTEHLLAALWAAGVDNLVVEIDRPELPGLDGSALPFYEAVREAGIATQGTVASELTLAQPVAVRSLEASAVAMPWEPAEGKRGLKVGYTLDLTPLGTRSAAWVGSQFLELELDEETFVREIAPARTFVLEEEIAALREAGLGRGANTRNTLVVSGDGVIENELRFPDEFVRHKLLDLVGDLYLLGSRLHGHVVATKSGHALNAQLSRGILTSCVPSKNGTGTRPRDGRANGVNPTSARGHDDSERRARETREIMSRASDGLEHTDIRRLLPHRYPMLLLDRVVEFESGKRAVGVKNVTCTEQFFEGHFPDRPIMPGVLQVEAMAQLGGILLRERPENSNKLAVFLSIDDTKFRRPVVPGDQLVLTATLEKLRGATAQIRGEAHVGGKLAAEARMRFMLLDP